MPQNSYTEILTDLRTALSPLYEKSESAAIAREVLCHVTGIGYSESLSRVGVLTDAQLSEIDIIKTRLLDGSPMQYAIGQAFFMGRSFDVDESVLIPRPETEELVAWILDDYAANSNISILDIGTGSGCIAVSLKAERQHATVSAVDLSKNALTTANKNAMKYNAAVDFSELDFLDPFAWQKLPKFDIIVSNPPYIPAAEESSMAPNVLEWEPHTALFVPDTDPLIFYKAIAAFGISHLQDAGAVYCEIHKDFGLQTGAVFRQAGYQNIILKKDLSGHDRMIRASLK